MADDGMKAAVFRDGVHDATIEPVTVTELRDHESW
jgi:hypothetical protein